jgi:hypothetical protein
MFRTVLVAFAELERETIRDRMVSGQKGRAERGGWPTGQVVWGYRTAEGNAHIELCEEEATVIRRLFHLRAEGMSGTSIADLLNAESVLPPNVSRGHTRKKGPAPWSSSTVMRLIEGTVYRDGVIERRVGDEVFTFEVPPIVTAKEWCAAHKKHRGLSKVEAAGERRYKYPLSERLFHDHEGVAQIYPEPDDRLGVTVEEEIPTPPHLMFGQMRPTSDGPLRYYRCRVARKSDGKPAFCPGLGKGPWGNGGRVTAVQADLVEARILLWIMELLDDPEVLEAYLATIDDGASTVPPASLTDLRERLSSTHIQAEAIADTYLAGAFGDVDSAEARALRDSKLEPVVTLRARVEADIDRLEQEQAQEGIAQVTIEDLLAWEIVDNGEQDPNADEYTHADGQSRDDLRRLAAVVLSSDTDRVGALSTEVLEEVARYARVLDLSVALTPNPDRPMWPNLRVKFDPEGLTSISGSAWRSVCRGGCETAIHLAYGDLPRNAVRS